jgi:hypothetical protein
MKRLTRLFAVTTAGLVLVTGVPSLHAQSRTSALGADGTIWGGDHVQLEVTTEGATLEFDCASGSISKPLQVDAQGNFKVTGSFTREHPGPVMRDGPAPSPAAYSGSIQGSTMKLTVMSGAKGENMGDYLLVRGKAGRVVKCR